MRLAIFRRARAEVFWFDGSTTGMQDKSRIGNELSIPSTGEETCTLDTVMRNCPPTVNRVGILRPMSNKCEE